MAKLNYICKNCGKEFSRYENKRRNFGAVNCSVKCRGIRHSVFMSNYNKLDPPSKRPGVGEKISKAKLGKPLTKPRFHKKRIMSSGGYYLVWCPKHPRASKRYHYVFEHILVIEKHIGRFLVKGEITHHINGIKTDNRIENLVITNPTEHLKLEKSRPDWWGNKVK